MGQSGGRPDAVTTVETSLELLDGLQELGGATISALATHHDLAKSTVHRHLHTLYENEYVVRDGDVYHVSLKFLSVGGVAKNRNPLWERVRPVISKLAEQTGERALFTVEEHGRGFFIHRHTGENAVPTSRQSLRSYGLHSIASGKAILAHLPRPRVEEILADKGLPAATDNTITDQDELFEALERVRRNGIAFNDAESIEGLRAVAVPLMGADETVHGAISVSGSNHRLTGSYYEEELPNLLYRTANELELSIELPQAGPF